MTKKLKIAIILLAINIVLISISSFFFLQKLTLVGFVFLFFGLLFLFSSREYKIMKKNREIQSLKEDYQKKLRKRAIGFHTDLEIKEMEVVEVQIQVAQHQLQKLQEEQ